MCPARLKLPSVRTASCGNVATPAPARPPHGGAGRHRHRSSARGCTCTLSLARSAAAAASWRAGCGRCRRLRKACAEGRAKALATRGPSRALARAGSRLSGCKGQLLLPALHSACWGRRRPRTCALVMRPWMNTYHCPPGTMIMSAWRWISPARMPTAARSSASVAGCRGAAGRAWGQQSANVSMRDPGGATAPSAHPQEYRAQPAAPKTGLYVSLAQLQCHGCPARCVSGSAACAALRWAVPRPHLRQYEACSHAWQVVSRVLQPSPPDGVTLGLGLQQGRQQLAQKGTWTWLCLLASGTWPAHPSLPPPFLVSSAAAIPA